MFRSALRRQVGVGPHGRRVDAGLGGKGVRHLRRHQRQAPRHDLAEAFGTGVGAGDHGVDGHAQAALFQVDVDDAVARLHVVDGGSGVAITSLAPLAKAFRKAFTASGFSFSSFGLAMTTLPYSFTP